MRRSPAARHARAAWTTTARDSPGDSGETVGDDVASSEWVTQAVFLPDGTARDDVEVRFQARGARTVVLRLR